MRNTAKEFLAKNPAIYMRVRKLFRVFFPTETTIIQRQMMRQLRKKKTVFFVQVGAHNGIQGDKIHDLVVRNPHWKGLFIEPVPHIFKKLKRNYNFSESFIFENAAISTRSGTEKFYYVSEDAVDELGDNLPIWTDELGSFNRNHIINHLEILDPYIVEDFIETFTLEDILNRNNIEGIDLFCIDTEGFDYKVLKQLDFNKYRPSIILYEHLHLSDNEKHEAESLLKTHKYISFLYDQDVVAILRSKGN